MKENTPQEYVYCVEKSINYMLKHLSDDLSLDQLAGVANYSPFHFQKIFKQVKGESPKQYVARLRLEIAAHYLIIHNKRTVAAIAHDCGFSSPAVFARSFKQFFGITAEEMRHLPDGKKVTIHGSRNHLKKLLENEKPEITLCETPVHIRVKTMGTLTGFCMNTEFSDMKCVEENIQKMALQVETYNLNDKEARLMGVVYPHNNIYRTFIPVSPQKKLPRHMHRWEIKGGKFASFMVQGEIKEVFDRIHYFYNTWLPKSGYRIAQVYGIEVFTENMTEINYKDSVRELLIPIEPA
ncbi:MAG TPA: AraC family transcriptional regulator [Flavobacteriales bacterium]|nr:AraC family transcriptional regulator [Flavobacteriales bacterium]